MFKGVRPNSEFSGRLWPPPRNCPCNVEMILQEKEDAVEKAEEEAGLEDSRTRGLEDSKRCLVECSKTVYCILNCQTDFAKKESR